MVLLRPEVCARFGVAEERAGFFRASLAGMPDTVWTTGALPMAVQAMAQTNPDNSRAMAVMITGVFLFLRPSNDKLASMTSRIEVFKQMLEADPDNTMVLFGLAKEYEKVGQHADVIDLLEKYLARADDEGNAYGTLAKAYELSGNREKAIDTYKRGIEVAMAHGHPSMANEYRMTLDLDLSEPPE